MPCFAQGWAAASTTIATVEVLQAETPNKAIKAYSRANPLCAWPLQKLFPEMLLEQVKTMSYVAKTWACSGR